MMQSKVKQLARGKGFNTPEALSKKTGLTRSTLYNIWTGDVGKRQFQTMFIIAKVLQVPMEDLAEEGRISNEHIEKEGR